MPSLYCLLRQSLDVPHASNTIVAGLGLINVNFSTIHIADSLYYICVVTIILPHALGRAEVQFSILLDHLPLGYQPIISKNLIKVVKTFSLSYDRFLLTIVFWSLYKPYSVCLGHMAASYE
jgi:hypothetical protein